MIGNAHCANPLSLLPRKGELFCVAARFAVTTPFVKKVAQKRPQAFLSHKL